MADKRHAIMAAVVTRMQGITIANGYYSNLGQNVFEWRPQIVTDTGIAYVPTEQKELPAIHLRDKPHRSVAIELGGSEDHDLTIEFEIAHEATASAETMRKQIADVRKAIGVDPTWGGLASDVAREITDETICLQADRIFFRTIMQMKITFETSAFAEE